MLSIYDSVMQSKEIKKAIVKRIKELNLSVFAIAKELDIDYEDIKNKYLNSTTSNSNSLLKLNKIHALLDLLGMKARITLVVKRADTMDVAGLKDRLARHYSYGGNQKRQDIIDILDLTDDDTETTKEA